MLQAYEYRYGKLLDEVIMQNEGGFVVSKDADGGDGGWTFAGVTAKVFNNNAVVNNLVPFENEDEFLAYWEGTTAPSSVDVEMRRWQILKEIHDIYMNEYIIPLKLDEEADKFQGMYLSCAINCGVHTTIALLGRVKLKNLPITMDDSVGIYTKAFAEEWFLHYKCIIAAHPEKHIYLKGWTNRINYWLREAGLQEFPL